MSQTLNAQIVISATDRASRVFARLGNTIDKHTGRMQAAAGHFSRMSGATMAALGVSAYGVAGVIAGSVKKYADWEDQLAEFGNTVNVHGGVLDKWGDKLRDLAPKVGQTQDALLEATKTLAGRGMEGQEAIDITEDVGRAATASL